jgi:uncharacterized Zn-finger protein
MICTDLEDNDNNVVQHVTATSSALVIRSQSNDEIAGAVAHPTKPSEIRKLIRSKMIRCRKCKNRFTERHLYERHLRDKHPTEHLAYLIQIEEEMLQQRFYICDFTMVLYIMQFTSGF